MTKSNPGKYDCYNNAEPDEPMFVLLGRDKHAPTLVWLWAALRELDEESPEKVLEARQCASAMVEWIASKGKKAVGIAQSVLVGVLEMIRTINALPENFKNDATGVDVVRRLMCMSAMENNNIVGTSSEATS